MLMDRQMDALLDRMDELKNTIHMNLTSQHTTDWYRLKKSGYSGWHDKIDKT